eukprot:s978_g20.t1
MVFRRSSREWTPRVGGPMSIAGLGLACGFSMRRSTCSRSRNAARGLKVEHQKAVEVHGSGKQMVHFTMKKMGLQAFLTMKHPGISP